MEIDKIRILLADDELNWRNMFRKYWERYFAKFYEYEIIECEFAKKAIEEVLKTKETKMYFDIVVADINFSENEFHESSTSGFEIIELAKKICPNTKVIWYSAQSQETDTFDRFLKESKFLKEGFIDFQIKKAWIVQSFKSELDRCLKIIMNEKKGLLFPLSQLFGTYNYSSNEDDGFYKLTHSNFEWNEMKALLPNVKNLYFSMKIDNLLNENNSQAIFEYLQKIDAKKPTEIEMSELKSKFRFDISPRSFNQLQLPLIEKGIECRNDFTFDSSLQLFAEKDRLSRGFASIYENIARHNFKNGRFSEYVITHFSLIENELIIEIVSSGTGFNPADKFKSLPTGGLRAIYNSFKYYCQLTYESDKQGYNLYQEFPFISDVENGLKITLKFILPEIKNKNNKRVLLDG